MELFELKNGEVTFAPQAIQLMPFNALWKRDKSKDKRVAVAELAAVYFYADYKSDFSTIVDEQERLELVSQLVIGLPSGWKPDKQFNEAVDFYKQSQRTISTILLEDSRNAVAKVSKYLKEIDLDQVDAKGHKVNDIKKIADTLGNINRITESLAKLEEQVKKDILEKSDKLRGNRPKSIFEDGI